MIRGLVVFLTVLLCTSPASAVTLVEQGRPAAVIIVPQQPSAATRLAAKVLQEHLRQISGAELAIQRENEITGQPTAGQAWVLVGESKLAGRLGLSTEKLGPGGILRHAAGDTLALLGRETPCDPDATRYAVTTFLEDKLGVRWLWPGELGKVVPAQATVAIDDCHDEFTPPLVQRRIRNSHYSDRLEVGLQNLGFNRADHARQRAAAERVSTESGDWFAWQRLGGTMNVHGGHAFGQLWEKYGREHPDWFALQPDGTRDQSANPSRARLCKSNPELIAAIARDKIDELRQNPALEGVSLCPNDGGPKTFCTCPQCEALDAPEGRKIKLLDATVSPRREFEHVSLTDRMVYFWNAIAERVTRECPDARFAVYAYSAYNAPPVHRRLHPSLVVGFVQIQYADESLRQQGLRDWDAWSRAAHKLYFRPNLMLAGRRSGMPLIYVHKFAQDFRHLAGSGMWGTDFDSCLHNWATQGLNYYVVARLNWDPNLDVDAIIDDYCQAGFGPAAKPVRAYFDRLEAVTNEIAARRAAAEDEEGNASKLDDLAPFTAAVLAELQRLLDTARQRAAGDEVVLRRLALLERGLQWAEIEVQAHAVRQAGDGAAAKPVLDARWALMREIFQQDFLALNVAAISWGEDGYFRSLGWKRP